MYLDRQAELEREKQAKEEAAIQAMQAAAKLKRAEEKAAQKAEREAEAQRGWKAEQAKRAAAMAELPGVRVQASAVTVQAGGDRRSVALGKRERRLLRRDDTRLPGVGMRTRQVN